ncbi:MAG: transcriptional coactivator p15/PC4 family protein [Leptospiraceae bacterium]|nr:transcriptional coactivator p15/PC4 family protein [Leptospiraceae bacterium]
MSETGIIKDIDKGKGEIIRVEISEFKGKKLLNLRVWYTDANGEYKPTQKGIAIPPELYDQVKEAINAAGGMF